jgi:hypothetical protein
VDRLEHVGEDGADDEIDLVPLEKAFDFCHGNVGLEFVIDDAHFRIEPTELAP